MSHRFHGLVWIDHREADVFRFDETSDTKVVINSHTSVQRLHHQNRPEASEREPADTEFFARIVSALDRTAGLMIAGPGEARHDFERYVRRNRPDLGAHVHGVDTVGHPDREELIALARDHFQIAA